MASRLETFLLDWMKLQVGINKSSDFSSYYRHSNQLCLSHSTELNLDCIRKCKRLEGVSARAMVQAKARKIAFSRASMTNVSHLDDEIFRSLKGCQVCLKTLEPVKTSVKFSEWLQQKLFPEIISV